PNWSAVELENGKEMHHGAPEGDVVHVVKHLHHDPIDRSPQRARCRHEQATENDARQRPCNRGQKFGARTAGLHLGHLGYAAKNEKRNLANLDTETLRNETMTQLVQQDETEECKD